MENKTLRRRDLLLREIPGGWLIIACDSCGAIGQKAQDALPVSNEILGRFNVRVPILEILAVGGEVIAVSDAVCNEMEPTGREIIEGIQKELAEAGVQDCCLTGSTEENFPTPMTAVGVTAVGLAETLKTGKARRGDYLLCIGRPHVGMDVLDHREEILSYAQIRELRADSQVREISPAGSGGIGRECEELARLNGLRFRPAGGLPFRLTESCGPACCAAAVVSPDAAGRYLEQGAVFLGIMEGREVG